jgi:hypothetical protein
LEGRCGLMPNWSGDHNWNDPCHIKKCGKADLQEYAASKKRENENALREIDRRNKQIEVLKGLTESADDMPPLPSHRAHDHFNIGDKVMEYIYPPLWAKSEHRPVADVLCKWIPATVINGYRHHDGCVSTISDVQVHTNKDYHDGRGGGSGVGVPLIMLKSEHDWFAEHPDRFRDWMRLSCDHSFNGNAIDPEAVHCPKKGGVTHAS